jgi:hypothetical protein
MRSRRLEIDTFLNLCDSGWSGFAGENHRNRVKRTHHRRTHFGRWELKEAVGHEPKTQTTTIDATHA